MDELSESSRRNSSFEYLPNNESNMNDEWMNVGCCNSFIYYLLSKSGVFWVGWHKACMNYSNLVLLRKFSMILFDPENSDSIFKIFAWFEWCFISSSTFHSHSPFHYPCYIALRNCKVTTHSINAILFLLSCLLRSLFFCSFPRWTGDFAHYFAAITAIMFSK